MASRPPCERIGYSAYSLVNEDARQGRAFQWIGIGRPVRNNLPDPLLGHSGRYGSKRGTIVGVQSADNHPLPLSL